MKFEIWVLFLESPEANAVFMEERDALESARLAREEYQDAITAAWIVDKETRKVIH